MSRWHLYHFLGQGEGSFSESLWYRTRDLRDLSGQHIHFTGEGFFVNNSKAIKKTHRNKK